MERGDLKIRRSQRWKYRNCPFDWIFATLEPVHRSAIILRYFRFGGDVAIRSRILFVDIFPSDRMRRSSFSCHLHRMLSSRRNTREKIWRATARSEKASSSSSSPFLFVSSLRSVARTMTAGFLIRSRRGTRWKKEEFWPPPGAWEATSRVRCCRHRNLIIDYRSLFVTLPSSGYSNAYYFSASRSFAAGFFLLLNRKEKTIQLDEYWTFAFSFSCAAVALRR